MFSFIGTVSTIIMLMLLPSSSFRGSRKPITFLLFLYSIMYFIIIQCNLDSKFSFVLPPILVAAALILYLVASTRCIKQSLDLKTILIFISFVTIPILLSFLCQNSSNQINLIDIFILLLILMITKSHFVSAPMVYQNNTIELYGVSTVSKLLILFIFLWYRKINIKLFLVDSVDAWALTLMVTLICCVITFYTGYKTKVVSLNTEKTSFKNLIVIIIFNFLHVALAEEIIYRGFIYTYLQQLTGEPWIALALSTLFFGYQHIKKMFVVASLAGFFYGLIYILTDNLLTAVIIHTVVNIVWRVFFVLILPTASKSAVKSQIEVTKS